MNRIKLRFTQAIVMWLVGIVAYAMGAMAAHGLVILFDLSLWWLIPPLILLVPMSKNISQTILSSKASHSTSPITDEDLAMTVKDEFRGHPKV